MVRNNTSTLATNARPKSSGDAAACIATIEALTDRSALLTFWEQILKRDTPGFETGKALEYFVLQAFKLEGADVTWPFSIRLSEVEDEGDDTDAEQIDGAIFVDGINAIIEAKDLQKTEKRKGTVDIEPIAKLRNQLHRRPGLTIGMIFSTNGFTPPAKSLSRYIAPQTILLWDGDDIKEALENDKMGMRGV